MMQRSARFDVHRSVRAHACKIRHLYFHFLFPLDGTEMTRCGVAARPLLIYLRVHFFFFFFCHMTEIRKVRTSATAVAGLRATLT